MARNKEKVVDDNTLFLLMALKYQDKIEIEDLHSVYTNDTNYDETIIKPNREKLNLDNFAEKAIKWIDREFGLTYERPQNNDCGEIIILSIDDKTKLDTFLKDYLSKFVDFDGYYDEEAKHKKLLYNFIKKEEPCVFEYNDKVFTYKLLKGENRALKYKMLEYIFYLMEKKILSTEWDCDMFLFNTDEDGELKKSIRLKFHEYSAAQFFYEYFDKKEKEQVRKKFSVGKLVKEGGYLSLYEGSNVCLNSNIQNKVHIDPKYGKVLLYCLTLEGTELKTSPKKYVEYYKKTYGVDLTEYAAKQYLSSTSKMIKNSLGLNFDIIKFIPNSGEEWVIKLKP